MDNASNSADFQPPTRNPQSDVGGGLQPNSSNVQPNGESGSLNPQALPKTNDLRVLNSQTQARPNDTPPPGGISPWISPLVAVVLLALLVWGARKAEPADKRPKVSKEPATTRTPVAAAKKTETKGAVLKDKVVAPKAAKKKAKKKKKK